MSLAFDSAGNLYAEWEQWEYQAPAAGLVYKFTPSGAQSTFASG